MMRTDQTLLQQMQISEVEIRNRMDLLELGREQLAQLSEHKALIEENIDVIVDEFYEKQTKIDEISLLIGDADTLARLRLAQQKYVTDLFSGDYDVEYVNNRLRIGMVHKRIGVEPKLYLSAVMTLKSLIFRVLKSNIHDTEKLENTLEVLDKLLYFDTTLVFDTYIDSLVSEIENAKRKTELYAKGLEEKVAERTEQLERQARLDPLTNLYNQRALQDLMYKELLLAKRHQACLSLIYFDIDEFKAVNDSQGHIRGDEVLKTIGDILLNNTRETDIACRYGGDEFCVILPDCSAEYAENLCKKIIQAFSKKCPTLTLSMGICETGPVEFLEGDELIRFADEQMYLAKKEAGFQVCVKAND
ncbi:GGDEF domain-containing protein [Hydrogenovibrio marinus]|uniref:Diguanylate cyclase DosC n=1 Tax=Hydrogenovibrio marinus TaxID=28885 RepID=A0A066ZR43_HYDMR|nr:GGDEF domain-containing protein [Hydrogenovibrio marinus]KDN96258.1 diguanylate cyclase [Hydrogenovibrio marinus]BBN60559.1 sensor histidine kinase [Hydrogenovibrio marinus]